jgi:hypothetical protein
MRKSAYLFPFILVAGLAAAPLSSQSLQGPPADMGEGSSKGRVPGHPVSCGTHSVDPATRAAVQKRLSGADQTLPKTGSIRIPVAFHLITSGREGAFSRKVVNVQIHNLNAAFAATPFSFYLSKLNKTKNADWYSDCFDAVHEEAMKRRLAYKPAQVLNVYSCKTDGPGHAGVIGYATYPWEPAELAYLQGVVIDPGTLPTGAGIEGFDQYGLNLVHETGHWLGLYHTFEGGCADKDEVADTPAQAKPTFVCDLTRDSCPASPGLDDARNYMDYEDDFCYDHFTEGQAERMIEVVRAYRPGLR